MSSRARGALRRHWQACVDDLQTGIDKSCAQVLVTVYTPPCQCAFVGVGHWRAQGGGPVARGHCRWVVS